MIIERLIILDHSADPSLPPLHGLIQDFWLGGGVYVRMLECQKCIRYVIVLAILHIFIGIAIGLTNKLQNRRIEL